MSVTLRIGSLNTRTLRTNDRLAELEEAIREIPFDVIGLQEMRRSGLTSLTLSDSKHLLVGYGTRSANGTGFLVNHHWASSVIFHSVNDRLSYLDLPSTDLRIINIYANTSAHSDQEYLPLLNDLSTLITSSVRRDHQPGCRQWEVIVLDDFCAKVGSRMTEDEEFIGRFGYGGRKEGGRNERRQILLDFCNEIKFHLLNTRFKKRPSRQWTWQAPNMSTKNQIDYILCKSLSKVLDVEIAGKLDLATDHRLLMAKLRFHNLPRTSRSYYRQSKPQEISYRLFTATIHTVPKTDHTTFEKITKTLLSCQNIHDTDSTKRTF